MTPPEPPPDLAGHIVRGEEIALDGVGETMWVDVIKRMDEVYSELLRNESDLERKNAELEEAQAFISSVFASVSDVLIVCDEKLMVRQVNRAFARLVGAAEASCAGMRLEDFVVEEDRARLTALHAASRLGAPEEAEIRFSAGGVVETLALRAAAQFTADRRRVGCVFSGRPISELKRAYQALHEAHVELQQAQDRIVAQEKMASLGRLVAGVAHELNNPISFIFANIHTLQRYVKSLARYLDALHERAPAATRKELRQSLRIDTIRADLAPLLEGTLEGAVRVTDIVRNLRRLSFSGPAERRSVDLAKLARTAASLTAGGRATQAQVVVVEEGEARFFGHEGPLHQVIVNLVDNALYAVRDRKDGRVEIRVGRRGGELTLTVADNGPGIAAQDLSKIFEPFFTTKPVGEGTGLGLWISFSIVRECGGTISAGNGAQGGAEFVIRLPAG